MRENEDEDALRKVGMRPEHRIDPQVQVGLLMDPGGFDGMLSEGNLSALEEAWVPLIIGPRRAKAPDGLAEYSGRRRDYLENGQISSVACAPARGRGSAGVFSSTPSSGNSGKSG